MTYSKLGQADFDDLSAFFDGELPPQEAAAIEQRIDTDPIWRQAYEELLALDVALGRQAAPPSRPDLAERIIQASRGMKGPSKVIPLLRRLIPAAAAAAAIILLVVPFALRRGRPDESNRAANPTPDAALVNTMLKDVPQQDRFVVENLEFFQNYDVLANYETLEAVDRLEEGT